MSDFFCIKQPVVKDDTDTWVPLYDLESDLNVSHEFFSRYWQMNYYTKGKLHFYWDKLLCRNPQPFRFWIEYFIKDVQETKSVIHKLREKPEVEFIDVPEEYITDWNNRRDNKKK